MKKRTKQKEIFIACISSKRKKYENFLLFFQIFRIFNQVLVNVY